MAARRESSPPRFIITAIVLVASVIAAGIIISSMQGPLTVSGAATGLPFLSLIGLAGFFFTVVIVILVILLIMQLITLLLSGKPNVSHANVNVQKRSQLGAVLALLIVVAMILVGTRLGAFSGLVHFNPIHPINSTIPQNSTSSTTGSGFAADIVQFFTFFLFVPLMITIAVLVGIGLYVLVKPDREEDHPRIGDRSGLATAVERQIDEIEQGKDPRKGVIEVYREMRMRLGMAGALDRLTFTAREFGNGAVTALGLTPGTVNELTYLYEEAKFSIHPITEAERESALTLLKNIVSELRT